MSESFTILPVNSEIRAWLSGDGYLDLPQTDGREATFEEIKSAIAALPNVVVKWDTDVQFPGGDLQTSDGLYTSLLIIKGINEAGFCEFYFRGGHRELIEQVVVSLSKLVGPLVIFGDSGSFTKIIHAS